MDKAEHNILAAKLQEIAVILGEVLEREIGKGVVFSLLVYEVEKHEFSTIVSNESHAYVLPKMEQMIKFVRADLRARTTSPPPLQ